MNPEWMQAVPAFLRTYPEVAVFLAVAAGNLVGRLRVGAVPLGSVAGSLLAGVGIGIVGIDLPVMARQLFFLLFLFATGYGVGPQFFSALRRDGLKLALFSVLLCLLCAGTSLGIAWIMGWDAGTSAGLLAGANTSSIIIGIATDTLNGSALNPEARQRLIGNIPMAYAVTYIFGTAGTAWFMAALGTKLLDRDVAARCRELEASMGAAGGDGIRTAYERTGFRAHRLAGFPGGARSMSVAELEKHLLDQSHPAQILRVARDGAHLEASPEMILQIDDVAAVMATHAVLPALESVLGEEVVDELLMSFPVNITRITIANRKLAGRTLASLRNDPRARGLGLRWLKRGGVKMPLVENLALEPGDQIELVGLKTQVDKAAPWLGFDEQAGTENSIVLIAATIAAGIAVGLLKVQLGFIPLTLSLSGGVLLLGLLVGWACERNMRWGHVPTASLWLMQRLGLDLFIAMVGLGSSVAFFNGLRRMGPQLFLAGVVVSLLPVLLGLLMGRYLFKFHPAITLGATAGARTEPASLAVVQNALKSEMPALGFTVPYAVANIMLAILAVVMVEALL
jgi:putative transport protein